MKRNVMNKLKIFSIVGIIFVVAAIIISSLCVFNKDNTIALNNKSANNAGDIIVNFVIGNKVVCNIVGLGIGDTIDAVPYYDESLYPAPPGTDKTPSQWYFGASEFIFGTAITEDMVDNNIISIRKVYFYNTYTITFVLPDGTTTTRTVTHGGNVSDIPLPEVSFPNYVSYDKSLTSNVTSDGTVIIEIKSYLIYIIIAAVVVFIAGAWALVKFTVFGDKSKASEEKVFDEMMMRAKAQDERIAKLEEKRKKREEAERAVEEELKKEKEGRDDFDDFLKKV